MCLQAISGVLFPMNPPKDADPGPAALQHSFVRSGCIGVMLDAVAKVMALPFIGAPTIAPLASPSSAIVPSRVQPKCSALPKC